MNLRLLTFYANILRWNVKTIDNSAAIMFDSIQKGFNLYSKTQKSEAEELKLSLLNAFSLRFSIHANIINYFSFRKKASTRFCN
jgi:hypothetical protein